MAKIRHIAYRAEDVEGMANFFVDALGLEIVRRREMGAIDLTDGAIGVTILPSAVVTPAGNRSGTGVDHIGFTVSDEDAQRAQLLGAGATETNAIPLGEVFYELKFHGPEGIIIDVGHWVGTAPIDAAKKNGAHKNGSRTRKAVTAARRATTTARKATSGVKKAATSTRRAASTMRKTASSARRAGGTVRKAATTARKTGSRVRAVASRAKAKARR